MNIHFIIMLLLNVLQFKINLSTVLHPRVIVHVKHYFQVESTHTLNAPSILSGVW